MLDDDWCWERLEARDRSAEGRFVVGVTSTGIFCRPGCPARTPLRRNTRFFAGATEAMAAGFRACRRCRPLAPFADIGLMSVEAICRHIEERPEQAMTLDALATRAGYSAAHFQRRFRAAVGLSPREYLAAVRARHYRRALRIEPSATAAMHAAGYGSTARVADRAGPLGAVTPTQYRAGGAAMRLEWLSVATAFGPLLVAATERGVAFAAFGATQAALAELAAEYPRATIAEARADAPSIRAWGEAISEHLAGRRPDPRMPLDVQGTAFQHLVWSFLQSIPTGQTRSYKQVAAAVGRPAAVRAAASACGANRVSLLIPCHRVIRGDGGLGGYRWGLDVKRGLLAAEAALAAAI